MRVVAALLLLLNIVGMFLTTLHLPDVTYVALFMLNLVSAFLMFRILSDEN